MIKILAIGDDGVSSGFGRISAEVNRRLFKRGYHIMAASLQYDGLLPAVYDGEPLPYHVASLQGKPNWPEVVMNLVMAYQPDIIWVTQDAPYCETVRNAPLDWSKYAFIMTTPVDGKPIFPAWVDAGKAADGVMTISEFGVQAWREAGVRVELCRPGIYGDKFYKVTDDERAAIRAKLGIAEDGFVLGMMAMNQGRKAIPQTMKAFFDFAQDKPNARLLMDMDEHSLAGWQLPEMCRQFGWDASKLIYRTDAVKRGVIELRDRYNALDAHSVLAYREGFGLPVLEAMACGVVSMAQDWCAGTEVVGDGRGMLVPSIDYFMPSTWGNALDKLPDYKVMTAQLQFLHDNPDERRAIAKRGMEWARQQTWDKAVDNAQSLVDAVMERRKRNAKPVHIVPTPPAIPQSFTAVPTPPPDGVTTIQLSETVVT